MNSIVSARPVDCIAQHDCLTVTSDTSIVPFGHMGSKTLTRQFIGIIKSCNKNRHKCTFYNMHMILEHIECDDTYLNLGPHIVSVTTCVFLALKTL